jgi:MerR family copper efflux transcriptional regulator
MGRMIEGLKIGELSDRCGVSADTVRFYEREGLLPRPRRSSSRYRLYGREDEGRLRFIRRAQALGLTLEDIRELMTLAPARTPAECRRVAETLRARVAAVDEKIAQLRAFRRQLLRNLDKCEQPHGDVCPVVVDLASGGPDDGAGR